MGFKEIAPRGFPAPWRNVLQPSVLLWCHRWLLGSGLGCHCGCGQRGSLQGWNSGTNPKDPEGFLTVFQGSKLLPYYAICQQNRQKKQPLPTATMRYDLYSGASCSLGTFHEISWAKLCQRLVMNLAAKDFRLPELLFCKYSRTRSTEPHSQGKLGPGPGNNKMLEDAAIHDDICLGHYQSTNETANTETDKRSDQHDHHTKHEPPNAIRTVQLPWEYPPKIQ